MSQQIKKIVLAYSGGLDTSVMVKWLAEKYQAEIVCYSADLGQGENLDSLEDKAINSGASKIYIENLQDEFIKDYVFPALKANALYENKYPLATALARPLIASKMIEIAKEEGADAVAHGCTGKGNDQVRFDFSFRILQPNIKIIAPLREWSFGSRDEEIDYAKLNNIPVSVTKEKPYSIDRNLWGVSVECGVLENPWCEPPADVYQITTDPLQAPDKAEYLEISFEKGVPVAINGEISSAVELVKKLNQIGGVHGIGRIDMVENRLVGIKSREIYEAPAAIILHAAHQALEDMVLERETSHYKAGVSLKYAEMIYFGQWFTPLRKALQAFVDSTQQNVTGVIRVKLLKGNCIVVGRKSPHSLYIENLATYTQEDTFDHGSAEGFIKLWGLSNQVYSQVNQEE
ncbi:MAG: argininosuccinate synthase [Halanaerobiales bacterium]|nr:argininosuccinate synthase [Halanaerobiales bacterium]